MEVIIFEGAHKFICGLEKIARSKIDRNLRLLSSKGRDLGFPHCKRIRDQLFELRIQGEQNIRLFYTFSHNSIYVVSGFLKKTNKLPANEILKALNRIKNI